MTLHDPRLDRIAQFDPRSRAYGILEAIPPDGIDLSSREIISKVRIKAPGPHLDQGREGACVTMAFTNLMRYEPHIGALDTYNEQFAIKQLYRPAQLEDEFEGEEPEMSGTSVLAVLRVAKRLGLIKSFHWAFDMEQLLVGLGYFGCPMVGINWYRKMSQPAKDGRIKLGGPLDGGHCVAIIGYNKKSDRLRIAQSWGDGHGDHGEVYMMREDMDQLLHERGECAFIVKA